MSLIPAIAATEIESIPTSEPNGVTTCLVGIRTRTSSGLVEESNEMHSVCAAGWKASFRGSVQDAH